MSEEGSGEVVSGSSREVAGETEARRKEYNQAASLGRRILALVDDRERRKLTGYLSLQNFPQEEIAAVRQRAETDSLSPEDVARAKEGSLALALEAAAQIIEAKIKNRGVREDLTSLEALIASMQEGDELRREFAAVQPEVLTEKARAMVARRRQQRTEEIDMGDEQLASWAEEEFQKAKMRLIRSAKALREYLGR